MVRVFTSASPKVSTTTPEMVARLFAIRGFEKDSLKRSEYVLTQQQNP